MYDVLAYKNFIIHFGDYITPVPTECNNVINIGTVTNEFIFL